MKMTKLVNVANEIFGSGGSSIYCKDCMKDFLISAIESGNVFVTKKAWNKWLDQEPCEIAEDVK
jgi:hypothetical protein